MMEGYFLPHVPVTTIVWAHSDVEVKWHAALGDDLKNQRPAIELNLVKVAQDADDDVEKVTQLLIDNWLPIYILLCTRQDLISKKVRRLVSGAAEDDLARANFKAIKASRQLDEHYTRVAIDAIRGARTCLVREGMADLFQRLLEQLDARLALMEADAALRRAGAEKFLRDSGLLGGEP